MVGGGLRLLVLVVDVGGLSGGIGETSERFAVERL